MPVPLSTPSIMELDWIKLPGYKSAWYTHHSNQLKYFLSRMEYVNGYVPQTIRISVVSPSGQFDTDENQLNLAPMCASVEERGLYLSKLHLDQLGLRKVGERDTRNFGTVDTYTGVKIRIAAEKCKRIEYDIPDGYVFETPEIYSSSVMVSIHPSGIPERQGIINRELLYQHGLMSCGGVLYALPQDLFQISDIPQFMSRYPVCEVAVASDGSTWRHVDMNESMRRLHDVKGVDGVHPSLSEDFYESNHLLARLLRPLPITYLTATPQCCYCHKMTARAVPSVATAALPGDLFYCPLCRTRHVQSPHTYCSKRCQVKVITYP